MIDDKVVRDVELKIRVAAVDKAIEALKEAVDEVNRAYAYLQELLDIMKEG